uniref:ECSIT domain-containing protein n=1 Tax=Mesocestoides corti TaxID=53468 RepID=A0A5K3EQP4_MESCO
MLKRSQIKRLKKAAFMDTIELYKDRSGTARRGFNEFILAALKQMKEYEVADDLEAYKALLTVPPRMGRLKAKSFLHADMGAYKRQQDTISKLLMQLNASQVMPDDDVGDAIVEIFGFRSHVMTHYRRMMYWVPKLRHVNPWPVTESLPDDLEGEDASRLAQLVAARICPDVNTEFTTVTADSKDAKIPSCLVSAQSSTQRALLSAYATDFKQKGTQDGILYLDGPQFVWFRTLQLAYYVLWGNVDKQRLQTQLEYSQATARKLTSITDFASWEYRIYGSEKDSFAPLQVVQAPEAAPIGTSLPIQRDVADSSSALFPLRPKKSSLLRKGDTTVAERRRALWAGFEPTHQITHLPEHLTRHEQAEGVILAVGVVAPVPNALENQARAYGGETSGELPDPTVSLPVPAPDALVRQWLIALRELNPGLDGATVVIRKRNSEIPVDDEASFHEQPSTSESTH